VLGREPVLGGHRCRPGRGAHHQRVDHEGLGCGGHDPFGAAPALAFLDQLDESGLLEGPHVVVDALARHAELAGQLRRRARPGAEAFEQPAPQRRQGEEDLTRFVQQFHLGRGHRHAR
jgi:hypothetical protein